MAETATFEKLVDVMRTLRSPEGCPWDRDQTLDSLTHFVLEEAHEVVDAIERGDMDALREEIGDHIFEGVFLAQIAAESGLFTDRRLAADGCREAAAAPSARVPGERPRARRRIQRARAVGCGGARSMERAQGAGAGRLGPAPLDARQRTEEPASLLRAYKIGKRVASVGFEWATTKDVMAKIEEEVAELRETLEKEPDNAARAEEEMGDLFFAIANLSRRLGIEPEAALRKANEKFTKRFNQLEAQLSRLGPHAGRCDAGGDGCGVGEDQGDAQIKHKTRRARRNANTMAR